MTANITDKNEISIPNFIVNFSGFSENESITSVPNIK